MQIHPKIKASMPTVLNLVKDGSWCYACGIISIIAFIPVLSFEAYETWKARKQGWNQITSRLTGMIALMANASWMLNDTVFNGRYHAASKWLFGLSFACLIAYGFTSYRQAKRVAAEHPKRLMTISREMRGVVFVHNRVSANARSHHNHDHQHRLVVPRRLRNSNVSQ